MMLEFTCCNCGRAVQGEESLAGKRVQCPVCRSVMTAPGMSATGSTEITRAADQTRRDAPPLARLCLRRPGMANQAGPGETLQLKWDLLPVRALWRMSPSLGWFLYLLFKKIYGIPMGSTRYVHGDVVACDREQAPAELLTEEQRFLSESPAAGFAVTCRFLFPGDVCSSALLSSDGQIGLLMVLDPAQGHGFWCSCTSILPGGGRIITQHKGALWSTPAHWQVVSASSPGPEAVVDRHRERIAGREVLPMKPWEVADVVESLHEEIAEHYLEIGLLFYAPPPV